VNKKGLGKGLSALIPSSPELVSSDEPVMEIEIHKIRPNSFQPRRRFDEEKLNELAESIKEHGVVQPVVVRPVGPGKYELVVGERRLRACQRLGLVKIPAVVKEFSDGQMMEIALVENIQRQDLNPVEEAVAYKRLMEEFKLTQEQVSQKISKSRSFIANMVRLLNLPDPILDKLSAGQLTVGHARPLLALNGEELQIAIAQEVCDKNLSVRETESLVRRAVEEENKKAKEEKIEKDNKLSPIMLDIEAKLRSLFGTKVKIKDQGERGKIEIDYYSTDDLERIVALVLQGENI
jgi:ParB family chromosome partitioning protein